MSGAIVPSTSKEMVLRSGSALAQSMASRKEPGPLSARVRTRSQAIVRPPSSDVVPPTRVAVAAKEVAVVSGVVKLHSPGAIIVASPR